MPSTQTTFGAIVLLLAVISWHDASLADDEQSGTIAAESPRAVVARWLELHRTGKRDAAAALTTGSHYHRADVLLPSKRDMGVRVERSLGNQQAAAVVTNSVDDTRGGKRVLLFWLVRRDGIWQINKSDSFERPVVNERLRGFLEAGDVRWHVPRDQLLGHWESGPCRPPGLGIVACGSRLQLGDDNHYRLVAWGPGGPDSKHDEVMQGGWRLADGRILLSHQDRAYKCRVAWLDDNLLVIEHLDETGDWGGRAEYERSNVAQGGDGGEAKRE
jgi:hypothetical protein